ncbi:DNRLRE domain-containing protein [Streptomyces sp. NBC_00820]|uniref:DNRLRE domain-containing protein n=1 Tax=Streptomyces sp. NBC_00820 TaxID=2975842 RepID=UPI002ED54FF7|nr:DNRLRE domain-containing protein [Streptomyces sp. NBC_00820]
MPALRAARRTAVLAAAALTLNITLAAGIAGSAVAAPALSRSDAQADGTTGDGTAGDAASALSEASDTGEPVHITGLDDEFSTTYANPDGTLTTQLSEGQQRIAHADGTYAPVDLTLRRVGKHGWMPRNSPVPVVISGGGSRTAATMTKSDGSKVGVGWPSRLPAPKVHGGVATYRVSAAENLVVSTTASGFTAHVVLTARPSRNLALKLPLVLGGKVGVRQTRNGALAMRSGTSGVTVASAHQFTMWDSAHGAEAVPDDEHKVATTLAKGPDGSTLMQLRPSMKFLTSPRTVYPVTIDPDISSLSRVGDTYVYTGNTTPEISSYRLMVGTWDSGTTNYRSYLNWKLDAILGKHVVSAQLKLYQYDANTCTPQPISIHPLDSGFSSSTVWANKPVSDYTASWWVSDSFNHGDETDGCANASETVDITKIIKGWVDGTHDQHGIVMNNAGDDLTYGKRFCSMNPDSSHSSCNTATREPTLAVTYNTLPAKPSGLQATPGSTSGSAAYVTSTTPALAALVKDADANSLTTQFSLATSAGTVVATGSGASVASGAKAAWSVPAGVLSDRTAYKFQVRSSDGTDYSAWSSWLNFTVDTSKAPKPPADLPTALQSGATQTLTPILSGVASAPSGNTVQADFLLYDSTGAALGGSPLATIGTGNGERAAVQVPAGLLNDGSTYTWKMRACSNSRCSGYTDPQSFTVHLPGAPATPTTTTTVIGSSAMTQATVDTGATDCSGSACTGTKASTLKVGASGTTHWRGYVLPDLSSIPSGAQVTSATLSMGTAGCMGGCEAHDIEVHPLNADWATDGTGTDLVAAASGDTLDVSAADPAALDVTSAVQLWLDGSNPDEGLALQAADEGSDTTTGATYPASGTKLTVTYLVPGAPDAPTAVTATPASSGLLVHWNAPENTGYSGDITSYTVTAYTAGTTQAAQTTVDAATVGTTAVLSGLVNGGGYTVTVTATTSHGTSAPATSALTRPAATHSASGTTYQSILQQYLDARSGLLTGTYASADAAVAGSANGASFSTQLHTDEDDLLAEKARFAGDGLGYSTITTTLAGTTAGPLSSTSDLVYTHHTGTSTMTDGSDQNEEDAYEVYTFDTSGPAPVLTQRLSADDFLTNLSASDTAAAQVPLDSDDTDTTAPGMDAFYTDGDALPADSAPSGVAKRASFSHGGTASWAAQHYKDKDELRTDCTNFASKSLNRGGGAHMEYGSVVDIKRSPYEWWRKSKSDMTYSWSAANNFANFMGKENSVTWVKKLSSVSAGDIMLLEYAGDGDSNLDHAGVIYAAGSSTGSIKVYQHSSHYRKTNLAAIIKRRPGVTVYIAHITPHWY